VSKQLPKVANQQNSGMAGMRTPDSIYVFHFLTVTHMFFACSTSIMQR